MGRTVNIPRAAVEKLYYQDGLSQQEIASRLGCSESTVRRCLAEYGLPTPRRDRAAFLRRRAEHLWHCHWSPGIAYVVGLIVSDGSLSTDGRHITFTSSDLELVETFCRCLRLPNRITEIPISSCSARVGYRVQFSDMVFYRWLLDIGLMPDKAHRLGPLNIPDEYFADFLRGYLDGDGSIHTYVDRYNTFKNDRYVYRRLFVRFTSASREYLNWLQHTLTRLLGTRGGLGGGGNRTWVLIYAKKDSLKLLRWIYYDADVPHLERKYAIAAPFLKEQPKM